MNISEITPNFRSRMHVRHGRPTCRSEALRQFGAWTSRRTVPPSGWGLREYHLTPLHPLQRVHSHLEEAVEALKELLSHQNRVLVHCTHGVNRSIAVVAATICDLRLATNCIQALKSFAAASVNAFVRPIKPELLVVSKANGTFRWLRQFQHLL